MLPKKPIVTLILASVGMSACGYKAPVYLPTPEQQQELDAKAARIKARQEAAKQKPALTVQQSEQETAPSTKQVKPESSETMQP